MLILPQKKETTTFPLKLKAAKKLKTACCKKFHKEKRCKRCPCFDLIQKAS